MPSIKNCLMTAIRSKKEIIELAKNTENCYRESAAKSYDEVLRVPRKDIFSNDGLELVYKTLKAFNMNARRAILAELPNFKKSLKEHGDTIQSLAKYRLEKVKETDDHLKNTIGFLFDGLELVQNNSRLVTFSKTMHFLLPDLFMPIDRKYTLQFFPRSYLANKGIEEQKKLFFYVFEYFQEFAHDHCEVLKQQVDKNSRWNRNIPKVIDNLIIAYVKGNYVKENVG